MDAIRSIRISRRDRMRNETIKQQMGLQGKITEEFRRKELIT